MHADMTAVTIQSNKIVLNEGKGNLVLLKPSYGKNQMNFLANSIKPLGSSILSESIHNHVIKDFFFSIQLLGFSLFSPQIRFGFFFFSHLFFVTLFFVVLQVQWSPCSMFP